VRVYRLETADGLGPWNSNLGMSVTEFCWAHPAPWSDGVNGIDADEYCCCKTLSDLRTWFFQNREQTSAVFRSPLTLGVYEVDPKHVRIGGIQCAFKRDCATLVRRFPLTRNR
jgi:hypothetical protein